MQFHDTYLIGLSLPHKTTHQDDKSTKDCGELWEKFDQEKIQQKIPNKISNKIFAVYHDYEYRDVQYFSYFIGCEVAPGSEIPTGLTELKLPTGNYQKFTTEGPIPDCMLPVWEKIKEIELDREFRADFEVYDKREADWSHAVVHIYISVIPSN
jgi:predicted transcriptional regulator YdeE